MRLALVDGTRVEAYPNLKGQCPRCGGEMIAKCGRVKVWHWSHKGQPPCDPWWESETEWHREWKRKFPLECQEIVAHDLATGEMHIADVKTPKGLVIEFQHSPISPEEIRAREAFYGEMIWIVDGTRGLDASFFNMGKWGPIAENPIVYGIDWMGKGRLFHNWSRVGASVYLDFGTEFLFKLITFDPGTKKGAVGPTHKKTVIEDCLEGRPISLLASTQLQK